MNSRWETRRLLHGGLLRFPNDNRVPARGAINWQERFAVLAQQTKDERLKAYYLAGMPTGDTAIRSGSVCLNRLTPVNKCHGVG